MNLSRLPVVLRKKELASCRCEGPTRELCSWKGGPQTTGDLLMPPILQILPRAALCELRILPEYYVKRDIQLLQ